MGWCPVDQRIYRSGMKRRNGMQAKMTASYVAITAGAVLIAEIVIIGVAALSPTHPLPVKELQARAQVTAAGLAGKLVATAGGTGDLPKSALGDQAVNPTPGLAQPDKYGGVVIPETSGPGCVLAPASFAVAVSPAGTVIATSYPACFTVGEAGAPTKMIMSLSPQAGGSGTAHLPSGTAV